MAISSVNEIWNGRNGTSELGGKGAEGAIRRYTRVFRVITDDAETGPQAVMYARAGGIAIPALTDFYRTRTAIDKGALCNSIQPRQTDDWKVWEVVCGYSSDNKDVDDPAREVSGAKPGEAGGGQAGVKPVDQQSNPLKQSSKVSITYERFTRVPVVDLDGVKVCNSSNEVFDPPEEIEDIRPVVRVTTNEATFDFQRRENNVAVNRGPFLGFPPGTARMTGLALTEEYEKGIPYFAVTREYTIDLIDEWLMKFLDVGFRELKEVGGVQQLVPIKIKGTDGKLHSVTSPYPLDGNGRKTEGKPAIKTFTVYNRF